MHVAKKLCAGLAAALVLAVPVFGGPVRAAESKADKEEKETRVSRVEVSPSTATVRVNQTRILIETVYPSKADQTVYWSSSNEDVVIVEQDGTIIGVSPGTATVTATAVNGKSGSCVVTVPSKVLDSLEQEVTNKEIPAASVTGGDRVSAAQVKADVEAAVRAAKGTGETACVTYTGKKSISAEAVGAAAFTAEYEGGKVLLRFDTRKDDDGVMVFEGAAPPLQGRMTIDPHTAGDVVGEIGTAVYTSSERVERVRAALDAAGRRGVPVECGGGGMRVRIAARADLSGLDAAALRLYRYDESTGALSLQENASLATDRNGFVHFSISVSGIFVISDQ